MTQITSGIRATLSHPFVYEALQGIMGAHSVRVGFVKDMVRPMPGQTILDIGCGTGSFTKYLPPGISYFGYDISADYIAHAQKHYSNRGRFVARAFSADELPSLPPIDTAIAIGLLHHLTDAECTALFKLIKASLKPNGRFVSLDCCITEPQNPIARFIIDRDRGQNVRDKVSYERIAHTEFREVVGRVQHRSWIPYTYWIMECAGGT